MSETHAEIELEKLKLENEKLKLEIAALQKGKKWSEILQGYLPFISILLAVAGFGFGVYQYRNQEEQNRSQGKLNYEAQINNERRDFMKPLLEKQLALYLEASEAASTIATTTDVNERKKALNNFWRLYYGPLVMVENTEVSGAMKTLGDCVPPRGNCDKGELSNLSLKLATKLQTALLSSWNRKPENYTADKFQY